MKKIFKRLWFWFAIFVVVILVAIPILQNKFNYHVFRLSNREHVTKCTTSTVRLSLMNPLFILHFPEIHDRCYSHLAKKTTNVSLCRSIWNDYEQNKCVAAIAMTADDISLCDQSYKPEWCQALVGEYKLDSNICLGIENTEFKDQCLSKVFYYSNNVTTQDCRLITSTHGEGNCLAFIAALKKDVGICPTIEDDYMRDHCYGQVGMMMRDVSLCDKIVNTNTADTCYINVSRFTNDRTICEKVSREYFRNECKNDTTVWED